MHKACFAWMRSACLVAAPEIAVERRAVPKWRFDRLVSSSEDGAMEGDAGSANREV